MYGIETLYNEIKAALNAFLKPKEYNNSIASYIEGQFINSDCVMITFINKGTADVTLNSLLTLEKDQSISFSAEKNELDVSRYIITFADGGVNNCVVIRKYYN